MVEDLKLIKSLLVDRQQHNDIIAAGKETNSTELLYMLPIYRVLLYHLRKRGITGSVK